MPMFPRLPRGVSRRILGILARYIALYACLIVLFAGLYAVWPDDFYQANIKSEPAARAEKAALGHEVKAAMNAQFEREPDLGRNVRFELLTGVRIGAERDNALTGSASISVSLGRADDPNAPENRLFHLSVPLLIAPDEPKVVPEKPGFVTGPDVTVTLPEMQGKLRYVWPVRGSSAAPCPDGLG